MTPMQRASRDDALAALRQLADSRTLAALRLSDLVVVGDEPRAVRMCGRLIELDEDLREAVADWLLWRPETPDDVLWCSARRGRGLCDRQIRRRLASC